MKRKFKLEVKTTFYLELMALKIERTFSDIEKRYSLVEFKMVLALNDGDHISRSVGFDAEWNYIDRNFCWGNGDQSAINTYGFRQLEQIIDASFERYKTDTPGCQQ